MAGSADQIGLRHATAADMDQIKPLWHAFYEHQFAHSMLLRRPTWLSTPGSTRWRRFSEGLQQITRIELQVVAGNPDGIRFYQQLGWHQELL